MRVDIHNHFYPGTYLRELEQRFAMMDATGIDVQIMSMTSPNVYAFQADDAVQVARMVNGFTGEELDSIYYRNFVTGLGIGLPG